MEDVYSMAHDRRRDLRTRELVRIVEDINHNRLFVDALMTSHLPRLDPGAIDYTVGLIQTNLLCILIMP